MHFFSYIYDHKHAWTLNSPGEAHVRVGEGVKPLRARSVQRCEYTRAL